MIPSARDSERLQFIAEISILHELSFLSFSALEEEAMREAVERASRLFGIRRMAVIKGVRRNQRVAGSWGFRNKADIFKKIKEFAENQFLYIFQGCENTGVLFMEHAHPIDTRTKRLYTIFARKVEHALFGQSREQLEDPLEKRTEELKKINEDLHNEIAWRQSAQQMERMESLGMLAGGLARDFNDILTAILGNISLCLSYSDAGSEISRRLMKAEEATLKARDLTQQLLTFSKGGSPVKKTSSVVEIIGNSTSSALSGSEVSCEYALHENLLPVDVDQLQIQNAIHHIVLNAVQAMPEGGTIRIRAENAFIGQKNEFALKPGHYVMIAFEGQGTGIPQEHLPKLFDPYFTTKDKKDGLGLATSYSIIRKHDGHLSVRSVPGSGTIFCIYLPASNAGIDGAIS
ncbi:MAG: sensor histidine kinase [Syntrophales bacterium]